MKEHTDILFHWIFILIAIITGFIIVLQGCASKPPVLKQHEDCVKVKAQKVATVYVCLEVGGDVKVDEKR